MEQKQLETDNKIELLFDKLEERSVIPKQNIFYDGQVFDAYQFVSGLIKSAESQIVLIDNYVDESVLTILDKRAPSVTATIYTQNITPQLKLDIKKHNAQYIPIDVYPFNKAHDRFLIIDDKVYHVGASLKDLGKKWFAFSLMLDLMAWYSFQDSVSWNVVGDMWNMYVGGTAGASLCTSILYDIANINLTEQSILYHALSKHLFATPSGKSATIEEFIRTKELVVDELKRWDSVVDEDSYQREYVEHSPDQINAILEEDIKLFQRWISERDRLELSLPKTVQRVFSFCSYYWIDERMSCYKEGLIHEPGFVDR